MGRFARAVAVGVAHHITQRGVDQQRVFFTDADRRTYLDLLAAHCDYARVRVLAYCLMPNHIHLVAVPEEPHSLATALRRAHSRYALYLNTRRLRTGHLWQNRYYSCALDEKHLWCALRYVELNPVRALLADRPADYYWSSAPAHSTGVRTTELLDWTFYAESGGRKRWATLLATPEELNAIRAIQRGTFTGRPVGSTDFITDLERQLNRRLVSCQGQRHLTAGAAA